METATERRVRPRRLQPNTPDDPVGRVPSRGVGPEIPGLGQTQRIAGILAGLRQFNDIFPSDLRSFLIGNRHVRDQSHAMLPPHRLRVKVDFRLWRIQTHPIAPSPPKPLVYPL